eukprot:3068901-Alexandrium_andersonii.AAC.1
MPHEPPGASAPGNSQELCLSTPQEVSLEHSCPEGMVNEQLCALIARSLSSHAAGPGAINRTAKCDWRPWRLFDACWHRPDNCTGPKASFWRQAFEA